MSKLAIIKIQRDMVKCLSLPNFEINVNEENVFEWDVIMKTAGYSNIFKKEYKLKCTFPQDYPFSKPTIKFVSYVSHPNVNKDGEMCLGILNEWKMSTSIAEVLNQFFTRFIEPDTEEGVMNRDAAVLWQNKNFVEK
jgi:ubiquitin-protein ligase